MALHPSALVTVTQAVIPRNPETSMASHDRSLFCVHIKSSGSGLDKDCHLSHVTSEVICSASASSWQLEEEREQKSSWGLFMARPMFCWLGHSLGDVSPAVRCGGKRKLI